ncbi:COP9 signalosome (CSN) subunit [Coemansia spiralis]|uniref:COP9 signalosome (CSN) subunit n=2 Tax=Coemansia TaxID=4863 RepID=A0A9W8FYZ2_9FUNG|nr:hypothetical protein BX070DRAFT_227648 [Coemansia spiralis]KAJ1988749.1 COP9 signalosome (CSN) subunit [Coemansia umbellata]KAJ2619813.1 COP9 signalosome (CSN) subunit [Coemansia sp. RSA 1358]KAJ2672157.1 COP9 signalosome (CSN) subunit [Coemansia spiralis]
MAGSTRLVKALYKFKMLKTTKNPEELAQIVPIASVYTVKVLDDIWKEDGNWDVLLEEKKRSLWDEMAILHFRASAAYRQSQFITAYRHQLDMYNAFLREFQNMSRWAVYALFAISKDLYDLARRADTQQSMVDSQANKVEEATRAINQGFSACMTDREPLLSKSRKWGTYHMANILFGLYLQFKAYNLCNSMIRAIKASELPSLDRFPMSDQVTFRFHRGTLAFRSEKYSIAKEDLLFALEHCHRDAYKNKTRILMHLTPIMMMEGKMPHSRLLRRYPRVRSIYGPLVKAVKSGDLQTFDKQLRAVEQQLVSLGLYMATEYVRKLVIRQLLYKVFLIEGRASRVPFSKFQAGFAVAGFPQMEIAEVECILADMIFSGYVKGYLAHDHGLAVLSKQMPFPRISTLHNNPSP